MDYTGNMKIKIVRDCFEGKTCSTCEICEEYGFELSLDLNKEERPLVIGYEGSPECFLEHITKELRNRRLHFTKYYDGYQVIKERCENDC